MSTVPYQRVKEVFYEASQADAAVRSDYLDKACDGDMELRREVERLFAADQEAAQFMEKPLLDESPLRHASIPEDQSIPARIGRYKIIRLIGEGGMGYVYQAEQQSPNRVVALKVIRAALPSKRMVQRFEREIEILGRLDHPNIAQIFDAGVADAPCGGGRVMQLPYYAMEFIDGVPLTEYAAKSHPSDRERLALLAAICDAVEYGHRQGVIHRDLKPGNILVKPASSAEGPAEPKIIDFGVARAANLDYSIATLNTHSGMLIGTLAYMSPEQVSSGGLRDESEMLDARSDVYSLGVIGFELLAGRLPYDLSGRSVPEAARVIRDEDPSSLSSISRAHRGDVETIIRRAMAKEPARRYQSAAEMAGDIRRFLNHQPIMARPPSMRYQLVKFARRHRELVVGLILVFLALIGGIVGTSIGLVNAYSARDLAQQRQRDADREAKTSQRVTEIVKTMLGSTMPGVEGGGRDVRVADLLDRMDAQLAESLAAEPEIEIEIRALLADSYHGLGLFPQALANQRRAFELSKTVHGEDHERTLKLVPGLAAVMCREGHGAEAEQISRAGLAAARKRPSSDHELIERLTESVGTAVGSGGRYDEAIGVLQPLVDIQRARPQSPKRDSALRDLLFEVAWNQERVFRFSQAEATLREALTIPPSGDAVSTADPTGSVRRLLAQVILAQGRIDESLVVQMEALEQRRRYFGNTHPYTIDSLQETSRALAGLDRLDQAIPLYQELAAYWRSRISTHPDHAFDALVTLASALAATGRFVEAEDRYLEAINFRRGLGGETDPKGLIGWRYACLDLGLRLAYAWRCEALMSAVRVHLLPILLEYVPTRLDLKAIDWSKARFRLSRWVSIPAGDNSGEGASFLEVSAEGSRQQLWELPDPEPGVYWLEIAAPTMQAEPFYSGQWILVAPWEVASYTTDFYPTDDPGKWAALVATPAQRRFELPVLCWRTQPFERSHGPNGESANFGLVIHADIELPPGRYRWEAVSDDGVRVWFDDQQIIDSWVGQLASMHPAEVEVPAGTHHVRVEYFQGTGESTLIVQVVPLVPSAKLSPLSAGQE